MGQICYSNKRLWPYLSNHSSAFPITFMLSRALATRCGESNRFANKACYEYYFL
jgi:hypothetical protein